MPTCVLIHAITLSKEDCKDLFPFYFSYMSLDISSLGEEFNRLQFYQQAGFILLGE